MSDSVNEYGMGAPNTQDSEATSSEVESSHSAGRRVAGGDIAEAGGMYDSVNEYGLGAPNTQDNPPEGPGFESDGSRGRVHLNSPLVEDDLAGRRPTDRV